MTSTSSRPNLQQLLGLSFDPDVVRARYADERDDRLHNGNRRYRRMSGEFERFFVDPSPRPVVDRAPVDEDVNVVVIGAGFGGLNLAARLRIEGVEKLRFIERGGDVGGNWYWNRYPGAACDTEAYCYLPLLEETGYMPSQRYTDAAEIQEHAQRIARHFDLYRDMLLQTSVTGLEWDEGATHWKVTTDRGDTIRARFIVIAGGETVGSPKLHGIEGLETFAGPSFHTARWDYSVTGGDVRGNLELLADKRVAVIGTGASGVQVVPRVAESAEHLYVFQRTPAQVVPRRNHATDAEWWKSLTPGWQQRRMADFIAVVEAGKPPSEPLNDSGFADLAAQLGTITMALAGKAAAAGVEVDQAELLELANMVFMEQIRSSIDEIIDDPATAEALKPHYSFGCKRPCWDDFYLEAFNRPNVTLVHTGGRGVDRITETSIIANGTEYAVDVIIHAAGYQAGNSWLFQLTRFAVVGKGGLTLEDHWADGYRTIHGIMVNNFPNYFQMSIIGNGLGANFLHANGEQGRHIAEIIRRCVDQGVRTIEPTSEAEDDWRAILDLSQSATGGDIMAEIRRRALAACTPGQYNNEGDAEDKKGVFANVYGGGSLGYIGILEAWRSTDTLDGVTLEFDGTA